MLVVGYDNLKNNTYTELKRMLDFVEYSYSEDNVLSLLCAVKSSEYFHRKHMLLKDLQVYSPELQQTVVSVIKQVNQNLLKYNISLL